jgi:ADP-ribose pyrophosphatase
LTDDSSQFHLLGSETVYRGRAFSVRRDQVSLPDGHSVTLDVVDHTGAVIIVPIDRDGRIWFVRQYRHAAGVVLLELPAGTLEAGEPPDDCAAREIREEIGLAAGQLEKIGSFFLAPGYSTEFMHVFLARDLSPSPLEGDADEFLTPEVISRGGGDPGCEDPGGAPAGLPGFG